MTITDLLPPPGPGDAALETIPLAKRRMLDPARKAGYELSLIGATVLPQEQTIVRTAAGAWLLVDHAKDPAADQFRGRIPIPESDLNRLRAIDAHGASPDLVWMAHELPEHWQEGQAIPALVPPRPALRELDVRMAQGLGTVTTTFAGVAGAVLGGAAAAPLLVPGALFSGIGLDPIILGGVCHPVEPIVQWAILAQWAWE